MFRTIHSYAPRAFILAGLLGWASLLAPAAAHAQAVDGEKATSSVIVTHFWDGPLGGPILVRASQATPQENAEEAISSVIVTHFWDNPLGGPILVPASHMTSQENAEGATVTHFWDNPLAAPSRKAVEQLALPDPRERK